MTSKDVEALAALFRKSERIVFFTGAGISTGSGIPDFRGPAGLWTKKNPVYYQEFISSEDSRREYWQMKLENYRFFRDAKPNAAHLALVELERLGKVLCLVTQNIDGLHQAAGSSLGTLVELHGTNAAVECVGCGVREDPERCMRDFEQTGEPPRCTSCSALMKPAVVMFGQSLDPDLLARAHRAAAKADLVVALGSSLVVTPAADVPLTGARRGTPYAIVNRGETAHDALATLRIDDDVVSVLPAAVSALG